MAQGILRQPATESGWEIAMKDGRERERISHGPVKKFRQQGVPAVKVMVVSGPAIPDKEQIPSPEGIVETEHNQAWGWHHIQDPASWLCIWVTRWD
jgi:hypothetical protein